MTVQGPPPGGSPPGSGPGGIRRKSVRLSEDDLVLARPLRAEGPLPLLMTPAVEGIDLPSWAERHRDRLRSDLVASGGILFRGFGSGAVDQFERLIVAIAGPLLDYRYGSTPRSLVAGKVYTSTEYPAHQEIPLHNEMSYSRDWPMKIGFLSIETAREGGETPIADSRRVFERIAPRVRDRFLEKGVQYVRNYGEGLDVPWQKVFQTEDRKEVEEFCRRSGIEWEWRDQDRLRTREVCQAAVRHPETGEMVWFNQAHLFHVSNVAQEAREALQSTFREEDLPRNAYYGDGAPIDDAALSEIREAYRGEKVVFPWQPGDVLLVENMLTAHGRRPFSGSRRVVVGMAESWSEVSGGKGGGAGTP